MRIAMLGIRGVPARYGGLETCAEEIGSRLAARGHEVYCYCRTGTEDDDLDEFLGIRRINLPTVRGKFTDTYVHSLLACFDVPRLKPDIVLAFNPAISSACIYPKLRGYPVVLNPDGYDWRRQKWGFLARRFIYGSAWLAARICDKLIIDAVSVAEYYADDFECDPVHVPNGANIEPEGGDLGLLAEHGLEPGEYFLFLSRHVPENSCEYVIRAYEGLDTDKKLYMGGGEASDSDYAAHLRTLTDDPRIVFPGAIYDPEHVKALHHGCYALIHANQAGGTSLGLLKAMGYGCCILTLNTRDNAYVVQDCAITYQLNEQDLRSKLDYLLHNPERVAQLRQDAVQRVRDAYDWPVLAAQYEAVFEDVLAKRRGGG